MFTGSKVIFCMADYLLIVPRILATLQFENCMVISNESCLPAKVGSHWPSMADLQHVAMEYPCSFIAATSATDADILRQMLRRLREMASSNRRVVYAESAIPSDLGGAFPTPLLTFLQRVQSSDLLCLSSTAIQHAATTDSMLTAVLRGTVESVAISLPPSIDRFPQADSGDYAPSCGISPDVLESAVDVALAGLKMSSEERKCVKSGVLLLWDFLNESHEISQTMEGCGTPRTADYWHGIMHRREPDPGNASYWFHRVGAHPAFETLSSNIERWLAETGASDEERELAQQTVLSNGKFDPYALIQLSTLALRKSGLLEDRLLRRMQYLEMLNLLAWSMSTDRRIH